MTRRLLCISGHVDSRLTGNSSPPGGELRHRCGVGGVDGVGSRLVRSSLFAPPPPTSRDHLLTSRDHLSTPSSSFRVPPQRLAGLTGAAGRMLSPTEAVHEGRRAMAPPNVTVVHQRVVSPFGPPQPPAAPASSMLSYLYQSGLYSAAAAAAAQQHHPAPSFNAGHRPPPVDGIPPPTAGPFLPVPPPISAPPADVPPAPGFAFPAPAELTSAGLVAAAAAAAGLHLNPAALMLSAAGQLAAHPWLYPGYLAAAAALGQSAAAVQALQTPPADAAAASPACSPSPRHRGHHHHHHHIVSSSSRFAPYPPPGITERRRSASGQSTPGTERSPAPRAATPPPAPDTTDSPPAAEVASPSPPTASPGPPSHCDDGDLADRSATGQLKNMEQMVNGLDHVITARTVTSSGAASNDADVMDVDSSKT